jgi:hypothetical protein
VRPSTLHEHLREALKEAKLPTALTWYQCTRHTFASQWVMANGSTEKLAAVLGHSSTEVTRRYAHMKPDHFREADRQLLDVDFEQAGAAIRMTGDDREAVKKRSIGQKLAVGRFPAGAIAARNAVDSVA